MNINNKLFFVLSVLFMLNVNSCDVSKLTQEELDKHQNEVEFENLIYTYLKLHEDAMKPNAKVEIHQQIEDLTPQVLDFSFERVSKERQRALYFAAEAKISAQAKIAAEEKQ